VNAANVLGQLAILFSTSSIRSPDWPHIIVIYHFIFLISFSNISYFTIPPNLRENNDEFVPLMEKLSAIDLLAMPLILVSTLSVWMGILLSRHRLAELSSIKCMFGNWVFFGKVVDLGSGGLVGAAFVGAFFVVV